MTPPLERSRLFWRLQFSGWAIHILMGITFGSMYLNLRDALLIATVRTLLGISATSALRPLYRLIRRSLMSIWLSGSSVFLLSGALALADSLFVLGIVRHLDQATIEALLASTSVRWMIYWLWSLLYFGITFWLDTEGAKLRLAQAEAEVRTQELRFLQAQINPHFLFNALNTILAETDNPRTRSVIQALAEHLRFSIQRHEDEGPLGLELDALGHYLEVEKARFQERLVYTIEASADARQAKVPPATVQPLVENAIKYGRRTSPSLLTLEVSAWVTNATLHLTVYNSGRWIPPEENASTRTGLENLRRRLSLIYGDEAILRLTHDEHGVVAKLCLPASRNKTSPHNAPPLTSFAGR